MSPDSKPNKHAWNELGKRVRGRVNAPANVHELFQALKQEWVAIPAQMIYNLIRSMPESRWAVTDSRGGLTPTDVTQSQNTEWLNFFFDEKNVKIMKFDLN